MTQHAATIGEEEDIFAKLRKKMADAAKKEDKSTVSNFTKLMLETYRPESVVKRSTPSKKMGKGKDRG